jgi:uncharacterized phage protein gp47/JayE
MPIVTLSDLVGPVTQADALGQELAIATTLGLQTSTWQPLDPSRTILQINAQIISNYSVTINQIAQGGYASYAALMTDPSGAPITVWMDLISTNMYNVFRNPATAAAGPVPYTNTSATSYPYSPNSPLKFQNPIAPNATYTSTGTGTVSGSSTGTIPVQADAAFVGTAGSAGVGTTLILLTPKSGVTIGPQAVSLVGATAESNTALLTRGQAKLGTLSSLSQLAAITGTTTPVPPAPGGSGQAYYFVATTIPQASVASAVWPYAVTARITRVSVLAIGGGIVDVYIANSSGTPSAGDVAAVNAAVQALCVPQAVQAIVTGATNLTIAVTYTVYVTATSSLSPNTIQSNISNALSAYFASLPIGGVIINGTGIVPLDAIVATILNANAGTVDLQVALPTTDLSVGPSLVPVLGTVTASVVLV